MFSPSPIQLYSMYTGRFLVEGSLETQTLYLPGRHRSIVPDRNYRSVSRVEDCWLSFLEHYDKSVDLNTNKHENYYLGVMVHASGSSNRPTKMEN